MLSKGQGGGGLRGEWWCVYKETNKNAVIMYEVSAESAQFTECFFTTGGNMKDAR